MLGLPDLPRILSILVMRCISVLVMRCILRLRRAGTILKVLMQIGVLLPLFLVADAGSLGMRGAQVSLPAGFRTDCAQRNLLLQILFMAGWALRGGRRVQHQILELMPALPAFIFKDWHEGSL
jgi:hypothetical protein